MSVTVYGASDDLVEVEGQVREEFSWLDGAALLAFSDGTVLDIQYKEGVWRISKVIAGASDVRITQAPDNDDDNYSDKAEVVGNVTWVVLGTAMAQQVMVPTPQERTELQRLAEALKLAERVKSQWAGTPFKDGWPPVAEHAYILASALLSLAAECEELRAENERLNYERKLYRRQAWMEAEKATLTQVGELRRKLSTLESRYSALEKAARHLNGDDEEEDGIQTRWDHYCSDGVGYCKAVSVSALEGLSDALDALDTLPRLKALEPPPA